MDAGVTAAARALEAGDIISALKFVAARSDPAALSLRGIAMARLGELEAARRHLARAERLFTHDAHARARCLVARAEVELALRRLAPEPDLDGAIAALDRAGDARNAAWARLVAARRSIVLGRVAAADASLAGIREAGVGPLVLAVRALAELEIALQRLDGAGARAAVARASVLAAAAKIPALSAEISRAARTLDQVIATVRSDGGERDVRIDDLSEIAGSGALVVDACRRRMFRRANECDLRARPIPFAILRALAEAHPRDVGRDDLAGLAFGALRPNESHRVRLRVEIGRTRTLVRTLAGIVATPRGYRLDAEGEVLVMAPPDETGSADVLSLVESGGTWTASSLAAALGCGVRRVQRALADLAAAGRVDAGGRPRAPLGRRGPDRAAPLAPGPPRRALTLPARGEPVDPPARPCHARAPTTT